MKEGGLAFGAYGRLCQKYKMFMACGGFEVLLTFCCLANLFHLVWVIVIRFECGVGIQPFGESGVRGVHLD